MRYFLRDVLANLISLKSRILNWVRFGGSVEVTTSRRAAILARYGKEEWQRRERRIDAIFPKHGGYPHCLGVLLEDEREALELINTCDELREKGLLP
jgi:hypothetical protein